MTWRPRGTPPSPTCCRPRASRSWCCSAASTRACTRPRPAGTSPGPGNRFWPALHQSGFTPRQLKPSEQGELTGYGLGITNIAPRATAQAAELTAEELRDGAARLLALIDARRPRFIGIAGVTAYRTAFARPKAIIGPQPERLGTARLWVLPNPSGLNASWPIARIVEAFRELRTATATVAQ